MMKTGLTFACAGVMATTCMTISVSAGDCDSYTGGCGLAVLPTEFQPIGARILGANYAFPGNPAIPCVNNGPAPMVDPNTGEVIGLMNATLTRDESNQTAWVQFDVSTLDGSPFITSKDDISVQIFDGSFMDATDFVIDFGNGYNQAGFPFDGADIGGGTGKIYIVVDYYFTRADGSQNYEIGDTTGTYLVDDNFSFAWGYDINDAVDQIVAAGFIATFKYDFSPCDDCPGDFDGNCIVNGADLGTFLSEWGPCSGDCEADFNGDGVVNGADFGELLSNWGDC